MDVVVAVVSVHGFFLLFLCLRAFAPGEFFADVTNVMDKKESEFTQNWIHLPTEYRFNSFKLYWASESDNKNAHLIPINVIICVLFVISVAGALRLSRERIVFLLELHFASQAEGLRTCWQSAYFLYSSWWRCHSHQSEILRAQRNNYKSDAFVRSEFAILFKRNSYLVLNHVLFCRRTHFESPHKLMTCRFLYLFWVIGHVLNVF